MNLAEGVQKLLRDAEDLSDNQLAILASVVEALKIPVEFLPGTAIGLVDQNFQETMANLLTLHHALHEEPLSKKPFEYAFKNCLTASGYDAELNPTPGDSSYDVAGAGQRWSLKTEAAKGISKRTLRIEKFMEARWVRECTTQEQCAQEVRTRIPEHMSGYDRIVVLRAFSQEGFMEYHLDEVPTDILLDCFRGALPSSFEKRGKAVSYGANFIAAGRKDKKKAFRLLLDSSVEKVRLWYETDHCIKHGVWRIRVSETQSAQQSVIA